MVIEIKVMLDLPGKRISFWPLVKGSKDILIHANNILAPLSYTKLV